MPIQLFSLSKIPKATTDKQDVQEMNILQRIQVQIIILSIIRGGVEYFREIMYAISNLGKAIVFNVGKLNYKNPARLRAGGIKINE
jgi:hypothetical protein